MKRTSLVIAVCALVGALAGIAGSAAAPSSKKSSAQTQKKAAKKQLRASRHAFKRGFRMGFGGPPGGPLAGPVHAVAVVPQRDGSGFDTITEDAGTLLSVDGTTVHLKEAVGNNVYKDDAGIDVGSAAKVIRNGADATLGDLKAGDHVRVITGAPKGNIVLAADDAFAKKQRHRFEHHGWGPRGHRGWGPGGGRGGPPPGAPGRPDDQQGGANQNGSDSGQSGSSSSS